MIQISLNDYQALKNVSSIIGTSPEQLAELIAFESRFNPQIKNPNSSARGLIQFLDKTAQDMGFSNSLDLVTRYPTISDQISGPVLEYLKKYSPYPTKQALFMAVFYPAAQYWPENKEFPDYVKESNPGINTPLDYMKLAAKNAEPIQVEGKTIIEPNKNYWPIIGIIAAAAVTLFILKMEV